MQHTNNNSAKVEEENQWVDMDVLMTLPIPVLKRSRSNTVCDYAPLIHDAVWPTVIEPDKVAKLIEYYSKSGELPQTSYSIMPLNGVKKTNGDWVINK